MKKWFFSDNGDVTGPLNLDEAKEFLSETPDVYAWHPSFSQWKPVNCVSEFTDVIPPTEQVPLIPKEISDKFLAKKQRLESKLTNIDDTVRHSQSSLGKLERQIETYRELTVNLNDDVKTAIDNVEKKQKSLSRKLSQVKDAIHIAEKEMTEVVEDFEHRMDSNDIFMPSCHQVAPNTKATNTQTTAEVAQISKAKLAQEKLATPHKRVEEVKEEVVEPVKATKKEKPAKKKAEKVEQASSEAEDDQSFGMKNMMKSVFKGDSKVEAKKPTEEPLSMAERLKLAQNNQ